MIVVHDQPMANWQEIQNFYDQVLAESTTYGPVQWRELLEACLNEPPPDPLLDMTTFGARQTFELCQRDVYTRAIEQSADVVWEWYGAIFAQLNAFDLSCPEDARAYYELIDKFSRCGRAFHPVFQQNVHLLRDLLRTLQASPERDLFQMHLPKGSRTIRLSSLIERTAWLAFKHKELLGAVHRDIAAMIPSLMETHPPASLHTYLPLVYGSYIVFQHEDNGGYETVLARMVDIVMRHWQDDLLPPNHECFWSIGDILFDINQLHLKASRLKAFSQVLRPYAETWTAQGLNALIEHAVLHWHRQEDELLKVLIRSPQRCHIPKLLADLKVDAPARFELQRILEVVTAESRHKKSNARSIPKAVKGVQFQDFNFKLLVIEELMYTRKQIQPAFDVRAFASDYGKREISVEQEGYAIIPEALAYFKALPLTPELLAQVTKLCCDGGNLIYGQIWPFWDGETEDFNVRSFADVSLLPNLREIHITAMVDDCVDRAILIDRGIKF